MKKAITLGLSLIMSVTMLCSCSKDDDSSSSGKRPDIPSNASVTLGEEVETDERKLVALEAKINSSGEQTVLMDSTDSEISLYFYTTHSGNKIYTVGINPRIFEHLGELSVQLSRRFCRLSYRGCRHNELRHIDFFDFATHCSSSFLLPKLQKALLVSQVC